LTGSLLSNYVVARGYYRVDNDRTKQTVVAFGTGSYSGGFDWTRLSSDANGNYFSLQMRHLSPGNIYKIVLLVDTDGQRQTIDVGAKFKVMV
jgi:hypothetical protein